MTITWSDIRPVHVALGVAMIAVWGILLYRVTAHLSRPSDEPGASANRTAWTMPPEGARPSSTPYAGRFRDPFEPPGISRRRSVPAPTPDPQPVATQPEAPASPQPTPTGPLLRGHTLIGVVDQTAMVREPGQRLRFIKSGEAVQGVRIVEVQPTYLVMQHEEQRDTLRIGS